MTCARLHLTELLDEAQSGQEAVITLRGKDVVRLVPVYQPTPKEPLPLEELAEFRAQMPKLRRSSAELIRDMRDDGY